MRILFFGDSITQGFWDSEGGWVQRIRHAFDKNAIANLETIPDDELVSIFNLGIQGETTTQLLQRVEAETRTRIFPGDPTIAVVALGTNDDCFTGNIQSVPPEQFRANLETIVEKLSALVQAVILVGNPACDESRTTPVSWGDYTYTNVELARSEHVIAEVANTYSAHYVPVFDVFKTEIDRGKDLLADGLHPNDTGHELIARLVMPKLHELLPPSANSK